MYNTKKEVDSHVRAALSKLRTESERHLRGFTIAKLYFKINEFASAEQHVLAYLTIKEDNDQAHKLLGQCYQRLQKAEKALQSYQRSLQLNPKQPDVLVEVCQLLLEEKHLNSTKAKYWCELAESEKVQHDAVFSLRLKLMNKDNSETNQVEELIQKEISARPKDVHLRVRLVRNYIEQNKIMDAFKYVYNLEMSFDDTFDCSSEWYNVMWLVLSKYEQMSNATKEWEFWLLIAICLERQVCISFTQTAGTTMMGSVTDTANLLFNMDQYLFKISQISEKLKAQKELVSLFLNHYHGQLCLHSASLIFKKELLQNKNKWKETVKVVLPLLLIAFQMETPDQHHLWMKHCDEQGKQLIQLWNREGAFRCAQVGRTLLSCINDSSTNKENGSLNALLGDDASLWTSGDSLLAQIRQTCSDKQWRRTIFALLFCNSDQKLKDQTSVIVRSKKLSEPIFELPTYAEVEHCEETAQYLRPQSLAHMIYLCLGNDNLSNVRAKYFTGLNFSTQNLSFCGAESLNQLDVETFLYASVMQAKRLLQLDRNTFSNFNSDINNTACRPSIMPFAILLNQLCSEEQANWWAAAYQVYKNLSCDNLLELRSNLQFGIEAVRGINGPKIDLFIVFMLGKIFVDRTQDRVKPTEKTFLESRAEILYKHGLNMLKMHNRGVLEPFRKYFKYAKSNSSSVDRQVFSAAEDAVSYLATRYFKKGEYEELIEELNGIQLPFATYLQAEAYRKLDEANKTPIKAKRLYLDRASECLNQTLTLLKSTQTDPNHPLNSVIHAELKRLQQSTNKFLTDSFEEYTSPHGIHSNSSTYEDAEAELFAESPRLLANYGGVNRSRRETLANSALVSSPRNTELELLVKQMATTLSFVKEEIVDTIKPEVMSMRKEIVDLKEKILHLEDAMKRGRITNPPSRDDASNVLDDFYIIDETLQNQLYQQQHAINNNQQHLTQTQPVTANNMYPATSCCPVQPPVQRVHTPNAMQMQSNAAVVAAANAYNSPMFNPNYPINYYPPTQYMLPGPSPQSTATTGNLLNQQRNPMQIPYLDGNAGINFNMPPPPTGANIPTASQDARINSLYNIVQQPNSANTTQLSQLSMPSSTATTSNSNIASTAQLTSNIVGTFNKIINNQPVEKGPPANVVISSSDPLPNPNSATLQTQQQTLSVTIPSHHIKHSAVQTPENPNHNNMPFTQTSSNVFSGFGFGGASSASLQSVNTALNVPSFPVLNATPFSNKTESSNSNVPPLVSATTSTSAFSFKPQVMQAIQKQQQQKQFTDATKTVTDDDHNKTNDSSASNDLHDTGDNEYDPRPDFKPIIPLPDEVDVKTGEENEEELFCYRAKLFRHIDNEWRERGIGNMKILRDKQGHSRILMRRDQTHKICANHKISNDMKLTVPNNETKGFIWGANDFADEEIKLEMFFVRFKLPETAKQFQDVFQQAQKHMEQLSKETSNVNDINNMATTVKPTFNLAKSNVTSFTTSTPSTKNNDNMLISKPDGVTTPTTSLQGASKTLFSGGNVEKASTDTAKTTASPFANFTFSISNTTNNESGGVGSGSVTSKNGTNAYANLFNNLKKPNQPSPFTTPPTFATTTPFSTITSVVTTTTSAITDSSAAINPVNKSTTSDTEDDYVPTAQFNPVIALPDLVEINTGEENEIILFEHRGKLLRYDKETGEWKERGLGNMKLLQHKDDEDKVRLVMRREQIHKLCCNQRLYKNTAFNYAKNSKTALTWAGHDFSEENLITEMLALRFKTADICKQFYEAILKAQDKMTITEVGEETDDAKELPKPANTTQFASSSTKEVEPKGFGDAFKPKPGSWSCDKCYVSNNGEMTSCCACNEPREKNVGGETSTSVASTISSASKFNFGFSNVSTLTSAQSKPSTFTFTVPSTAAMVNTSTASTPTNCNEGGTISTGFGDQFKPKAGSWSCQECYLSNVATDNYCKACEAPKDNTIQKKDTAVTSNILDLSKTTQKFNFGFAALNNEPKSNNGNGFTFGIPTTTSASDTSKSFSFGLPNSTAIVTTAGIVKPSFTFTSQSKAIEASGSGETTTMSTSSSTFSLDKKDFNFTLKPKSPGKGNKSPQKQGGGGDADVNGDDEEDEEEDEENNTYFTPVISLPDKIDVKTGEENEEVLYTHRAKLFRFLDGEWKERGVGDVKILRHRDTKKLRVVMRRDQVLKICLNHVLNDDVEYKHKDEKSWLFVVNDFSEGTVEIQKFSLRFKNHEIAEGFMASVRSAIDGSAKAIKNIDLNSSSSIFSNSMNTLSTLTDKKMADDLKLPYEFFATKPACEGCRGCDPDKFIFSTIVEKIDEKKWSPLEPLEQPALALSKPNRSLLKGSTLSSVTTNSPSKEQIQMKEGASNSTFSFTGALNSLTKTQDDPTVASGFLLGNNENDKTLFSGQDVTTEQKKTFLQPGTIFNNNFNNNLNQIDGAKSVFGGSGLSSGVSIFGGKSIFGGSLSSNDTKGDNTNSIFGNNAPSNKAETGTGTSLFGSTTTFGSSGFAKNINLTTSIFGGYANNNVTDNNSTKVFGNAQIDNIGTNAPIFGDVANKPQMSTMPGSVFEPTTAKSKSSSVVSDNDTNIPVFGNIVNDNDNNSIATPTLLDIANKPNVIDFATLAAQTKNISNPLKSNEKSSSGSFIGLTNQDAFSSFSKSNTNVEQTSLDGSLKSKSQNNDSLKNIDIDGNVINDDNYDPHYEPIIALPNQIVVSTGEENETKLFGERATLFRWDDTNKEWKERGVGELKILFHTENKTYRLILRREQIHKLVLNHAVGSTFTFTNMSNNPKSFVWAAMNYAESSEGSLEKLAVRFKKLEIAEKFSNELKECVSTANKHNSEKQQN